MGAGESLTAASEISIGKIAIRLNEPPKYYASNRRLREVLFIETCKLSRAANCRLKARTEAEETALRTRDKPVGS